MAERDGQDRLQLIAASADVKIPKNAGDFRLISSRVADALDRCHESNRYMRGLIAWLGFEQTGVEYERRPRVAGESKAPIGGLIVFTLNAFTSFSVKPLRMFVYFGFLMLGLSLFGAAGVHPPVPDRDTAGRHHDPDRASFMRHWDQ